MTSHDRLGIVASGDARVTPVSPPRSESVVSLREVSVVYPRSGFRFVLPELDIARGERVALVGASGSGKTTLLRIVNGRVPIDSGELTLFGRRVGIHDFRRRALRRRIGFIFQAFHLVGRATVFENVLWGRLGWRSTLPSLLAGFGREDRLRAEEAIREVDLEPQALQRVSSLSGGQQQRVGIARALVQEPDLILADEPVSNLDPETAGEVMELLERSCGQRGVTLVMTLHQPALARRHADRIVTLDKGRLVSDLPNPAKLALVGAASGGHEV